MAWRACWNFNSARACFRKHIRQISMTTTCQLRWLQRFYQFSFGVFSSHYFLPPFSLWNIFDDMKHSCLSLYTHTNSFFIYSMFASISLISSSVGTSPTPVLCAGRSNRLESIASFSRRFFNFLTRSCLSCKGLAKSAFKEINVHFYRTFATTKSIKEQAVSFSYAGYVCSASNFYCKYGRV